MTEQPRDDEDAASSGSRRLPVLAGLAVVATLAVVGWFAPWQTSQTGGADSTAGPGPAPAPPGDVGERHFDSVDAVDLDGTWAEKTVQTSLADIPVAGEVEARTINYRIIEIDQSGADLKIRSELCDTQIESPYGAVQTVVPDAVVESAPEQERRGDLREVEARLQIEIPRSCGVRGAELSDPATSPLPTEPGAESVVDGDDDGRPGVTVRVEGAVSGRMMLVQRGCDAYEGTVRTPNLLRGRLEWSTEQRVLDSNSSMLASRPDSRPHPDPAKSWFVLRRLGEETSCSNLLERRSELFARGGSP